jgi:ribosomal protein L11 methyltransferase
MMKPSEWRQISVTVAPNGEEAVAALLERLYGQSASVYVSAATREIVVTVYSPKSLAEAKRTALRAGLNEVAAGGLEIGPAKISIQSIRREDWTESWKKFFKTIEIGRALLIKPSWSQRRPQKGQATVVLDPGLSFGTGQHPTTEFCLRQLVACHKSGQRQSFLDIGTGSGILAIAAAKLGFGPVKAFDLDPMSVRVAQANARKNRVQNRLTITRTDLTRLPVNSSTRYDLICANLLDDLLISESKRILNRLHPAGHLVLAGILTTQFPAVQKAYEKAGLSLRRSLIKREWQSGLFALASRNPKAH